MRWLITGANGQLGTDLRLALADVADAEVRAGGVVDLDITDSAAVEAAFTAFNPDVVINAAAYTAVDAAEEHEESAYRVNATGPAIVAAAAGRHGTRLIHISTDYVFAGDGDRPYETDDAPAPQNAYGRSKLAGEQAVRELLPDASYVVRTAWVYGAAGANIVKTMVRLAGERETVKVVSDQRGAPTWSFDLARGLVELAQSDAKPGIYHCTNSGETTWYEFTREIFSEIGADPARVLPITTAEYPVPARRPSYSVLDLSEWTAAGLTAMPPWREALREAFLRDGDQLRGTSGT